MDMTTSYGKLKPQWKKRIIRALRSHRYRQTRGCLRRLHGGYCCLGVMCDLVDPTGWQKGANWTHQGNHNNPTERIQTTIGLSKFAMDKLVSLNDNKKYSFKQIADWIEGNL